MKYFSVEESMCPCGCRQVISSSHPIWAAANLIRGTIGKPLTIKSGYRCYTYNSTIPNAAKNSKHAQGCALDISTSNLSSSDIYRFIEEAIRLNLRIGLYSKHIHIDYSPTETRKFWYGTY